MIIFLTFWQGMAVAFLVKLGFIRGNESYSTNNMALAIQDLLITLEMPFFAIYHAFAFPWTDYDDSRLSSRLLLNWAIKDVLGVKDIIQDAYHVFKGTLFSTKSYREDIWNDFPRDSHDELSESSRLLHSNSNLSHASYTVDSYDSLEFPDGEDPETENDYAQSRKLEFGDPCFPVHHSDPRFANPPSVQARMNRHAQEFYSRVDSRVEGLKANN
jgi:hypothetical protein